MQNPKTRLIKALIDHFGDDDRRIEHALAVCYWAERILEAEGGDRDVVLAVGLLHDVGIKDAEARHGYSSGELQEQYGPAIAQAILERVEFPEDKVEESCAIVGAHHTPTGVPGPNFAILWDADMIVNIGDEMAGALPETLDSVIERSFKTNAGRELARSRFLPRSL